ncbi:unnamed protein product [Didymodactylos carnosus]|uniref:DED domain-containing protein n=1 Tax=Didymodactylos carnosus TaxID=1234261 RepID=A0A8S2K349_9BILA|nr:unnamed protein product [Didymodactylos carnosus]CAF3832339.1 unnamed protein product [Didymodactylos carnosus]
MPTLTMKKQKVLETSLMRHTNKLGSRFHLKISKVMFYSPLACQKEFLGLHASARPSYEKPPGQSQYPAPFAALVLTTFNNMSTDAFKFRCILIRIQESLSDTDRQKLHFLLGEDIPGQLREKESLSTSISAFQKLLQTLKISEKDCTYLINALEEIQRHDCAQRLKDYQNLIEKNIVLTQRENSIIQTNEVSTLLYELNMDNTADVMDQSSE